ncbi:MAG: hypothetical protein JNK29_08355 [Anaerolineales bacterium]|nr:hypothetical protein [Anaerolineales bacterium]
MKRLMALLGLAAGLGLGLLYTWVLSPVQYVDTDPLTLRADYKVEWMIWTAGAYLGDGDLERAHTRITALGESDPARAVAAQAQRLAAAGGEPESVQALAALAAALGAGPAPRLTPSEPPTPEPTAAPTATPEPTPTPEPSPTPLLLPTPLPSPTPPGVFSFVGQSFACDSGLQPPLLQVVAQDAQGEGVAGVEVIVEWSGGQDRFFTGLKPELGHGYGDFAMDINVAYTVRLASDPSGEISVRSDPCTDAAGQLIATSVLLTFQQPARP